MDVESLAAQWMDIMTRLHHAAPHLTMQPYVRGETFLLLYLHRAGGAARPGEMSRAMGVSSARISVALNGMEAKGLITREADTEDHRRTIVRLTERGGTLADQSIAHMTHAAKHMFHALGEHDAKEYLRILRRMDAITADATPIQMHTDDDERKESTT